MQSAILAFASLGVPTIKICTTYINLDSNLKRNRPITVTDPYSFHKNYKFPLRSSTLNGVRMFFGINLLFMRYACDLRLFEDRRAYLMLASACPTGVTFQVLFLWKLVGVLCSTVLISFTLTTVYDSCGFFVVCCLTLKSIQTVVNNV